MLNYLKQQFLTKFLLIDSGETQIKCYLFSCFEQKESKTIYLFKCSNLNIFVTFQFILFILVKNYMFYLVGLSIKHFVSKIMQISRIKFFLLLLGMHRIREGVDCKSASQIYILDLDFGWFQLIRKEFLALNKY